jgi:hypothetical protein
MASLMRNEKKPPLLAKTIINRFERSCGTFKGGKGKNPLSLTTLNQFARKKIKNKKLYNLKKKKTMTMG